MPMMSANVSWLILFWIGCGVSSLPKFANRRNVAAELGVKAPAALGDAERAFNEDATYLLYEEARSWLRRAPRNDEADHSAGVAGTRCAASAVGASPRIRFSGAGSRSALAPRSRK